MVKNITKKHEVTFKNTYGETMELVLDGENNSWFKHSDCNKDFENIDNLKITLDDGRTTFKYILDKDEQTVLVKFIDDTLSMVADEMQKDTVLNIDYNSYNYDVPRNVIRKAVAKACGDNTRLKAFVYKVFRDNPDMEFNAWEDYGWEWDIETYGGDDGGEMAIRNHDYIKEEMTKSDGWDMHDLEPSFAKYLDSFNFDKIRLPNGKYLMLIDGDDQLYFQIFDGDKMEDGKVDYYGIKWDLNGEITHKEFLERFK